MIKKVVVDVARTFAGPVVFLGCEQKMKRVDRNNAAAGNVPDAGKWTVTLLVKTPGDDGKVNRENINVTVESKLNPCQGLEEFDKVQIVDLEYNTMTNDRTNQAMAFWRAGQVVKLGSGVAANNGAR